MLTMEQYLRQREDAQWFEEDTEHVLDHIRQIEESYRELLLRRWEKRAETGTLPTAEPAQGAPAQAQAQCGASSGEKLNPDELESKWWAEAQRG